MHIFIFLLVIEILLVIESNPDILEDSTEIQPTDVYVEQSNQIQIMAIVLTALSLLIGSFISITGPSASISAIIPITLSIGFLMISYQLRDVALLRRIYYHLQEKFFSFGLLGLISSVVVFFTILYPTVFLISIVIIGAIFGTHLFKFLEERETYELEYENNREITNSKSENEE